MNEMVFQFKSGFQLAGDPQRVGEELGRIRLSNGGLSARAVVDAARGKKHYLHRYFTWDDSVAAVAYRDDEARYLIRSMVTVENKGPASDVTTHVRAFFPVGDSREDRYVPTVEALSQTRLRNRLLTQALNELRCFEQKYRDLSEISAVIDAINHVIQLHVPAKS